MISFLFPRTKPIDFHSVFIQIKSINLYRLAGIIISNLLFTVIFTLLLLLFLCIFQKNSIFFILILSYLMNGCIFVFKFILNTERDDWGGFLTITLGSGLALCLPSLVLLPKTINLSKAFSISSRIFYVNFISIFALQLVGGILLLVISFFLFLIFDDLNIFSLVNLFVCLFFLCNLNIVMSFMDMFMSSLVLHIKNNTGQNIFWNSLKQSILNFDSILANSMKFFIINELVSSLLTSDNFKNLVHSVLTIVLLVNIIFMLFLLFPFSGFYKGFSHVVFPFLLIENRDYESSIETAYQKIEALEKTEILDYTHVFLVIVVKTWIFVVLLYFINSTIVIPFFGVSSNSDLEITIFTIVFGLFFFSLYSIIGSAIMTLIFSTCKYMGPSRGLVSLFLLFIKG